MREKVATPPAPREASDAPWGLHSRAFLRFPTLFGHRLNKIPLKGSINSDTGDKMGFATSAFGQFMASMPGRLLRIVAGLTMLFLGWVSGGTSGSILAVVGLVPLSAGTFDFCVLSALFRGPFWGAEIRALRLRH
jgi:hypothetical protein